MIDVLVFVYENYWRGDACPEPHHLGRKLQAVGFERDEIRDALTWLGGLRGATQGLADSRDGEALPVLRRACRHIASPALPAHGDSLRTWTPAEQQHLGADGIGYLHFLEHAGALTPAMREIAVDRALAAAGTPLTLDDLKVVILMVFWSLGEEPDALVLDELCDEAPGQRIRN